jgi:glycosyltransferase involved in cell wall biosynthesis
MLYWGALSSGVPVICFDHQGVGDIITDKCGIKIPVNNAKSAILELREAIVALALNKYKLQKLSENAMNRAGHFRWSLKGKKMAPIYQEILANSKDFGV